MKWILFVCAFWSAFGLAAQTVSLEGRIAPAMRPYLSLFSTPELLFWASENQNLVLTQIDEATSPEKGKLVLRRHDNLFPTTVMLKYSGESTGVLHYRGEIKISRVLSASFSFSADVSFFGDSVQVLVDLPFSRWAPASLIDRIQRAFSRATRTRLQNELAGYLTEAQRRGNLEEVIRSDRNKRLTAQEQRRNAPVESPRTPWAWIPIVLLFLFAWAIVLFGRQIHRRLPLHLQRKWDALRL